MKKEVNVFIDDYTSPVSAVASEDTSIYDILEKMSQKNFRHIPVVKDNKPIGIISDRDLSLLNSLDLVADVTAKDIMAEDPYCVTLGTTIDTVAFEMSKRKIGSALVVNAKGELDGIFTSIDGLNALIEVVRGENE